jgi:signal transduction histidine kinase
VEHWLFPRVEDEELQERPGPDRDGRRAAPAIGRRDRRVGGGLEALEAFFGAMPPKTGLVFVVVVIVTRIDALDQMMKDLLLFARPPKPKRAPIDLVPLVRTTAGLLSTDPALREVDVEGTAPPMSADADMLRVVFQNFFINSAHAMQGKGHIRVAVEPLDTTCQIAFIDGGPGIPPDIREKIFTPFFTTKTRGSGLGLPTVKRLIEAHDGQIAIDCPPAGGTTVIIRLPMGTS